MVINPNAGLMTTDFSESPISQRRYHNLTPLEGNPAINVQLERDEPELSRNYGLYPLANSFFLEYVKRKYKFR